VKASGSLKNMRGIFWRAVVLAAMAIGVGSCTAQAPDSFRWIDYHSPNDQDVVNWVTRALQEQKWTAIREIGVQYDQALVITSNRNSAQGAPNRDSFSIWSVSLANRALTHIFDGTNLRIVDWLLLDVTSPRELAVLPVLRVGGGEPMPLPSRVLFEGPVSGTGVPTDWVSAHAMTHRTEVILAGGLSPANVAAERSCVTVLMPPPPSASCRPPGPQVFSGGRRHSVDDGPSRTSWPIARWSGWLCSPPAGATRTTRSPARSPAPRGSPPRRRPSR